jgi:hypothetical protein
MDMVRAARQVDKIAQPQVDHLGQSQGAQAVLFTGDLQREHAPELDFRGTISTAPISQCRMTFNAVRTCSRRTPRRTRSSC